MARNYGDLRVRILQMLQDTSGATYGTSEIQYWIKESLNEFSTYDPHIVPIIFKIESRTGVDVTGTTSKLTDLVKLQFVDLAAETEKVVHNTTDHTFATIWDYSSTSVYNLSADIMDANENYRIYNKNCWNNKQIYIGDVLDYLWIDSVEYPIGTKRNWKVYWDVLEIDVDSVEDSDSTLTNLGDIDVLIRFAKPHRLCQLGDLDGLVQANASLYAKSLQVYSFKDAEVAEIADEFTIAGHRQIYTLTAARTFGSQSSTGSTLSIYPGLEWGAIADRAVTFTSSTLKPQHEELFCHLVAARAVLSDNINYINAINKGGPEVYARFRDWGERKLAEVLMKLDRISVPQTKRRYPTAR